MAFSKIIIKINSIPNENTTLTIRDTLTGLSLVEHFVLIRTGLGFCPIGVNVNQQAGYYRNYFILDYNGTNLYEVTVDGDEVEILSRSEFSVFEIVLNNTGGAVTTVIDNVIANPVFVIDNVTSLEAAADPCDNVKLSVDTSTQADQINSPISQAVASNPFVFETLRADLITVEMENSGVSDTVKIRAPKLLTAYINLDILATPNGGTLTVNRIAPLNDNGNIDEPLILKFTYSLDDVDYEISNSFTNLPAGNYTVYIKDNIGCQISMPFTVEEFEGVEPKRTPVFEISNLNSIRCKLNQDLTVVRKNDENTLSYEERDNRPIKNFVQWFEKGDTIRTQIKSNYETQTAVLIDCDGNESALNIFKMTDNLNKVDVRDAHIINLTDNLYGGKIGVYFGAGNTYNPITLINNGSYNTGQSVMSWIDIGEYINIQSIGWVLIEDIIGSPEGLPYDGEILVLNALSSVFNIDDGEALKGTTMYDVVEWDRYEVEIPFATLEGLYQLKINGTDTKNDYKDVEYLSEYLDIKEEHEPHYLIEYYNTVNNEINYATGITHKLRVPYVRQLKWSPSSKTDTYVTDTNTILLESRVRQFYDVNIRPVPTAMGQKLVLALVQDRLFIDGVNYTIDGEPSNKQFGDTNLYQVKGTVAKSDYVFDSNEGKGLGEVIIPQGTPLEIDDSVSGLLFVD